MCVTTIAKSKIPETNPLGYLLVNPDVQRAGVDPVVHKRNFGISEGRQEFLESSILEINNLSIKMEIPSPKRLLKAKYILQISFLRHARPFVR